MSRYPPLTDEELRQIYQRHPTEEARRLLWEIARLQQLVFDQADFLATVDGRALRITRMLEHEALLEKVQGEPCMARLRAEKNTGAQNDTRPSNSETMFELFVGPLERWQIEARRMGESRSKRRRR